jgi:hypothetical protein
VSGAGGSSEEQNTNKNAECAHEVSNGSEDSIRKWTIGQVCYILSRNLSTFCACPETLWEDG